MEKTTREFYLAIKVDALQTEVAELKMAQAQYIKMLLTSQRAARRYRRLYFNKMGWEVDYNEV